MGIYEDTLPCGCVSGTCTLSYPPEDYITPRPGCPVHNGDADGARPPALPVPPAPPAPAAGAYEAHAVPVEPLAGLDGDGRPLLRISLQTRDGAFRTVTFACDTGASGDIYLDPIAWDATADCRLTDADGSHYRRTGARDHVCQPSTRNLLGLRLLASLGMRIDESGVGFDRLPPFLAWTAPPTTRLTYGPLDDAIYAGLERRIHDRVEDPPTPAEWAVVADHLASLSATVQEVIEETSRELILGDPERAATIRERVIWAANDMVGGWADGRPYATSP